MMEIHRNGKRIDFSADEIAYMRQQQALPTDQKQSYAAIARELGLRFSKYNGGHRSRQSVYEFMTGDPNAPINQIVSIDRDLLSNFRATGKDLQTFVVEKVKELVESCQDPNSEKHAVESGAENAAELSRSPPTSPTDTGTGSKGKGKKSGKATGSP